VLGCGGTIARHSAAGDRVHILILGEGAASRGSGNRETETQALIEAARAAAKVLGAQPPRLLGLPDNRLDTIPLLDVIQAVEAIIREVRPSTVYVHAGSDLNRDHRIAHEATVTACRPLPGCDVRRLLAFETLSSTEWSTPSIGPSFTPNRFVAIVDQLELKRRALECYSLEMRPFPHPRSFEAVEALARLRGSHVGQPAAEAFEVLLDIDG